MPRLRPAHCALLVLVVCVAAVSASNTLVASTAPESLIHPESHPFGVQLVVRDASGLASAERPIYFAGNINSWNPGSEAHRLTLGEDGLWRLALPHEALRGQPLEFKLTLGSWATEELTAGGEVISNRTLDALNPSTVVADEPIQINLIVPAFRQNAPKPAARRLFHPGEIEGELQTLRVPGGAGDAANLQRDLLVWLPPAYHDEANSGRDYPVLLLMDGQNVFSTAGGVAYEWNVDETTTKLITQGKVDPVIIVGVPNSGMHRAQEYLPYAGLPGLSPAGDDFVQWLVDEVLAAVRAEYRVSELPQNVAIGGASLGGTIALHAAMTRPDVFGKALVESLPLLRDDAPRAALQAYVAGDAFPRRIAFGMGGNEAVADDPDHPRNVLYREWARETREALRTAAGESSRTMLLVRPDHTHNERAWAERFPSMLLFLFGSE